MQFKHRVNITCHLIFLLLIIQNHHQSALGQTTPTIIFPPSTAQPTTAPPTTTPVACRCVAMGTCAAATTAGIDIRIVNTGTTACTAGLQSCCTPAVTPAPGGNNSSGLTDATCGTRKIALTVQPAGTASYGAYPWQAALLTSTNSYIGSGVLLDANNVLTVAHKVAGLANTAFKVRLGEWNGMVVTEQYPYQEYNVVRTFSHPQFNAQSLENDVAILRLNRAVPLATSPAINTACPPTAQPAAGTRCWVAGWGKNAFGTTGVYQGIMKEVDVPILDQTACETSMRGTRLGQFFTLNRQSFICAGGEINKDACTGDGGSPLVCQVQGRWQVVGLVAWGIGCAMTGVPGVYVNVFNYLTWIMQQIATAT